MQHMLRFSDIAALQFKVSTEHRVVEVERNTLVTALHTILEKLLDLIVFSLIFDIFLEGLQFEK